MCVYACAYLYLYIQGDASGHQVRALSVVLPLLEWHTLAAAGGVASRRQLARVSARVNEKSVAGYSGVYRWCWLQRCIPLVSAIAVSTDGVGYSGVFRWGVL